eukprot:GFKZ01007799.1.p1 GENE.GFKZ01007799.1~~GFKZ01007799.1.p1  ORF type:complete len:524 (+),score=50.81 GFKZ01007799.1:74-1645(+)
MEFAFTSASLPRSGMSYSCRSACYTFLNLRCRRPRQILTRKALTLGVKMSGSPTPTSKETTSTEETFGIDAGRDLFFPGMDAEACISILDSPLGSLEARDDRFIAAERIKFYPSDQAADSIISFVRRFNAADMDTYVLEDKVARRKVVESLGRHKGQFRRAEVVDLLRDCLRDSDSSMVEVAVWSLAQGRFTENTEVLEDIVMVLDNDRVAKRVVIQAIMQAEYIPALDKVRQFVDYPDPATRSAAMTAVAFLSGDQGAMGPVVDILKSSDLSMRRAAIEDITLSKFIPALPHVAKCPNSFVMRSRTIRVLLDASREQNKSDDLDHETAAIIDRLIWDHPKDLDLLGQKKETRKARDPTRNIRQLYKNDALAAYAACSCLAEDHRGSGSDDVAANVKKSYDELGYFDYFGAYHVYKTLGWLRYCDAYDFLLENATTLPPRFFNHQVGAITSLAELGHKEAVPILYELAQKSTIWELKYACLLTCEKLGDGGELRSILQRDPDWLIRARAKATLGFDHLRESFD